MPDTPRAQVPDEPSPVAERNLVKCPRCGRTLYGDVAGLSVVRVHEKEWVGLLIRCKCKCGGIVAADPAVLSRVLTVLAELYPPPTIEHVIAAPMGGKRAA